MSALRPPHTMPKGTVLQPGEKWCAGCMRARPFAAFARNANSQDGLSGYCRLCLSARYEDRKRRGKARAYYQANRERLLAYQKAYQAARKGL